MYFGIAGTIWSLRNPKNVIFLGSNDVNSRRPPLLTYLRDITPRTSADRGKTETDIFLD